MMLRSGKIPHHPKNQQISSGMNDEGYKIEDYCKCVGCIKHVCLVFRYEFETPYDKYSREMNNHGRQRRAAQSKDDKKNTCSLFIQTDPLIWKHIQDQVQLFPPCTGEILI